LIQSIHVLAIRFSEVAASVVHALMEFLGDSNNPSALDVVAFVRFVSSYLSYDISCLLCTPLNSEVVEKFPALRPAITEKLTNTLSSIRTGRVFRGVLWILGEYIEELGDIEGALAEIRKLIGEIPILAAEARAAEGGSQGSSDQDGDTTAGSTGGGAGRPRVLADGTYATETAYSAAPTRTEASQASKPPLRGTSCL